MEGLKELFQVNILLQITQAAAAQGFPPVRIPAGLSAGASALGAARLGLFLNTQRLHNVLCLFGIFCS